MFDLFCDDPPVPVIALVSIKFGSINTCAALLLTVVLAIPVRGYCREETFVPITDAAVDWE